MDTQRPIEDQKLPKDQALPKDQRLPIMPLIEEETLLAPWELDPASKKLFDRGRIGQGYCLVSIPRKEGSKERMSTHLRVAFNNGDGLPRVDKYGIPYDESEMVQANVVFGASGTGVIHGQMISSLKKELKLPAEQALYGKSLGGGLFKGVNKKEFFDECKIYVLSIQEYLSDKELSKASFAKNPKFLKKYKESSKYALMLIGDKLELEVCIIENGYIVNLPGKTWHFPKIILKPEEKDTLAIDRLSIIQKALAALDLEHAIIAIRNKSTSLNTVTILKDMDFINYIQYLDAKDMEAQGRESSNFFNLLRSTDISITSMQARAVCLQTGAATLETIDKEIERLKNKSWDNEKFEMKYNDFLKKTPEEKLNVYVQNIYITVGLMINALEPSKDNTHGQWKFHKNCATIYELTLYIVELKETLFELIISSSKMLTALGRTQEQFKKLLQTNFSELSFLDSWVINIFKQYRMTLIRSSGYVQNEQGYSLLDFVNYVEKMESSIFEHDTADYYNLGSRIYTTSIKDLLININRPSDKNLKYAKDNAQLILEAKSEKDVIAFFNPQKVASLIVSISKINFSDQEKLQLWKDLLSCTNEEGDTILMRSIKNKWFDAAKILTRFHADLELKNKNTSKSSLDLLEEMIVQANKETVIPLIEFYNSLIPLSKLNISLLPVSDAAIPILKKKPQDKIDAEAKRVAAVEFNKMFKEQTQTEMRKLNDNLENLKKSLLSNIKKTTENLIKKYPGIEKNTASFLDSSEFKMAKSMYTKLQEASLLIKEKKDNYDEIYEEVNNKLSMLLKDCQYEKSSFFKKAKPFHEFALEFQAQMKILDNMKLCIESRNKLTQ